MKIKRNLSNWQKAIEKPLIYDEYIQVLWYNNNRGKERLALCRGCRCFSIRRTADIIYGQYFAQSLTALAARIMTVAWTS